MNKSLKKSLLIILFALSLSFFSFGILSKGSVFAAVASQTTISIVMNDGAEIRLDEHTGLRFSANIGVADSQAEYHVVIVPSDYLADYASGDKVDYLNDYIAALNEEKGSSMSLNDQNCAPFVGKDGETYIRATITNVRFENTVREFTSFAYAVKDGTKIYSDNDSKRSVASVSVNALAAKNTHNTLKNFVMRGMKYTLGLKETDALPALTVNPSATSATIVTDEKSITRTLSFDVYNAETKAKVSELNPFVYVLSDNESLSYKDGKIAVASGITENFTGTLRFVVLGENSTTGKTSVSVISGFENYNVFAQNFASGANSWTPQANNVTIKREWNEELSGITVTRLADNTGAANQFGSANNRIYLTDLTIFKEALAKGYDELSFEYYSTLSTSTAYCGFAIWRNTDAPAVGNEYARVEKTNLKTEEWTTFTIKLADFFNGNESANYLSIVVVGQKGSSITFRNAEFTDSSAKLAAIDFFGEGYYASMSVQADANIKKAYDTDKNAVKLTRVADNTANAAQFTSNNNRLWFTFSEMKTAYEKGYKYFTFKYLSELTAGSGAFFGFRIYGNNEKNQNSFIYDTVTGSSLVTGEWTEFTIDLDKFFSTTGAENFTGLSFVVVGAPDTCLYLKDGFFSKKK